MRPRQHLPHHDGSPAHVPAGGAVAAPGLGDRLPVRMQAPRSARVTSVHLRTTPDAEPTYTRARRVGRNAGVDLWEADVEVTNPVTRYRFLCDGPGGTGWVTQAGWMEHDVPDTWDFALVATAPPPAWVADAVLYQIFPDRFARAGASDDWPEWAQPAGWGDPVATDPPRSMQQLYGGDLPGIAAHLDHLTGLGITGIYLTPIFAAQENHRYCAVDFDHVDPFLGGDDALAALSAAVHGRGLKLIGDLTLNHSGDGHPWFRAAQADPDSVEARFYHFLRHPDRYASWSGVPSLPKFDHRSPELARRLYSGPDSVAARWLRPPFSLDGWRVDAANMAGRFAAVDCSAQIQAALLATMRMINPDTYLLAEHCHDATADLQGLGWHGTMDYTGFTRPVWSWLRDPQVAVDLLGQPVPLPRRDGPAAVRTIELVRGQLPWRSVVHSLTPLGSHDTSRWAYVAGDPDRRHVGFAWQMTFPGIPSIYYGDELGLMAPDNESGRLPLPWHDQAAWDRSTLDWTRRLIALRRDHVALRHGGLQWLLVDEDRIVYLREHPDERVVIELTRAATGPASLDVEVLGSGPGTPLLDHEPLTATAGSFELAACDRPTARVWRLPELPGG